LDIIGDTRRAVSIWVCEVGKEGYKEVDID
jgi:hypothetical protein